MRKHLKKILRFKAYSDIALARDESSRFLPWIIALMVYLSALVLIGSFTLSSTINTSYNTQAESFSITISHIPLPDKESEATRKILEIIKSDPGVLSAEVTPPQRIREMVAPWLGKSDSLSNLPLPVIIEAKAVSGVTLDYDTLRQKIDTIAGGVTIDDHKKWIGEFAHFIAVIRATLLVIACIIIAATAFVVIFACKTSLKIHRSTVSLLHRLGAMDSYIAMQFQQHAGKLALKGAFIGCGLACITLIALHITASHINSPLFPAFPFSFFYLLVLFFLPLLTSALAAFAARISVLGTLHNLP